MTYNYQSQTKTDIPIQSFDNDFVYTGPSWAVQSYSSPLGDKSDEPNINIGDMFAKEFKHSLGTHNHAWLPRHGNSNTKCVLEIKKWQKRKEHGVEPFSGPVIWVLCDPLARLYFDPETGQQTWPLYKKETILYKSVTYNKFIENLLCSNDWLSYRQRLLHMDLKEMNELNMPIGIIGSHSDITYVDVEPYENLTVIEPSWQNVLCEHAVIKGMSPNLGADFVHQTIKAYTSEDEIHAYIEKNNIDKYRWALNEKVGKLMTMLMSRVFDPKITKFVHPDVVDYVHGQYDCWKQLEEKQLFNWVHPSVEGNLVFYEHVKYKMEKFVNANKK